MGEQANRIGSDDLRLPEALRGPLLAHLEQLRAAYQQRNWAGRVGFGNRPAVLVIDLARYWLDAREQIGSHLDPVVEAACKVLAAARNAQVPIFFTSFAFDPATPGSPHDRKLKMDLPAAAAERFELDSRLHRRPTAKDVSRYYA